jgi:hypothetical protein
METLGDTLVTKKSKKGESDFHCEKCHVFCSTKYNLLRHEATAKHLANARVTLSDKKEKKGGKIFVTNVAHSPAHLSNYSCDKCGKEYFSRNGLWKHRPKCVMINGTANKQEQQGARTSTETELMMLLIKENVEFKSLMIKMLENGTNNTTHTNSHNKSFNLNLFLNETCKDAMNISDFVSSIKLNLDDLENTGRRGYIEGISEIFLKNLNSLEQHMRPLHCSDLKREVLYIKNNNEWTKETEEKPILTKAIKNIANQNIKQIKHWREKYPDCTSAESKKNNMYLKIVSNSMNGLTEEESHKNINKIISNVAKESVIIK